MKRATADQWKYVHTAIQETVDKYASYFEPTDGWDADMTMEITERVMELIREWQADKPLSQDYLRDEPL